jgi:hypothetical protein
MSYSFAGRFYSNKLTNMKKSLLLFALVAGIHFLSQAQELGVRFGDVTGGNVALDAIFSTSKFSRIHGDVSFGSGSIGLDALYDFTYRKLGNDGFYWYLGAGPSAWLSTPLYLGISGELGAEYRFNDAPISLSLDWRPTMWIIDTTTLNTNSFGFNVRYIF